ncbi:MAG TPA: hypothetical protein VGK17_21370 [Propionicimonas sp.]
MNYLQIGSSWLHLVATVVLLGYVSVVGFVVLPVLRREVGLPKACELAVAFERRALPAIVLAFVAFLATGVYLTVSDARYGGAGNVAGSSWATIIMAKHALVALILGLGLYADGLIARKLTTADAPDRASTLSRLEVVVKAMAITGAAVLLLTAVAAEAA